MLLSEIARPLWYALVGDGSIDVSSLKYAEDADENSLAVAFSNKEVATTKARAVLAEPQFHSSAKTFIHCAAGGINEAILSVTRLMINAGIYYDYEKPFPQTERCGAFFGKNVEIGDGTSIAPLVSIGENVYIGKNCKIESGVFIGSNTYIGNSVIVRAGTKLGVNCHFHFDSINCHRSFCGVGRLIIRDGVEIGANTVIQHGTLSNTVIEFDTIIGNLVEIAHDVKIGSGCLIVSQVGICGNVTIGNRVQIYGQAGVVPFAHIGSYATVLAKSVVTKDIRAGETVSGMFSRDHSKELKMWAKLRRLGESTTHD